MKADRITLLIRITYSVIILALIIWVYWLFFRPVKVSIRSEDARRKYTEIYKAADVVISYYTLNHKLPANLNEILKTDNKNSATLLDPWNRKVYLGYQYVDKTTFTLISCGPDKKRTLGAPDFYDDVTYRTDYYSTGTTIPCDITLTLSIKSA
jgi:hypothetical protein